MCRKLRQTNKKLLTRKKSFARRHQFLSSLANRNLAYGKIKNSFKEDESKKGESKFIVGSYNPDKNYSFLRDALKGEPIKSNDIDLVGEENNVNSNDDKMIFGDLEL